MQLGVKQLSVMALVMGSTAVSAVAAADTAYPQYPTYITARGTVTNGQQQAPAYAAPAYVAPARMPVAQPAYAAQQPQRQPLPLPRYQPANGGAAVYYPAPHPMQVNQAASRYAVPVGRAPSVHAYAQPAYAAPKVAANPAQPYAAMAPAAGYPMAQTNANGNRFYYGDVQDTVPGAREKMQRAQHPQEIELEGGIGYRTGKMNWNISGAPDGTSPNVLSELDWKSLQFIEAHAGTRYVVPNGALKHVHVEASGYYAFATAGDNQDSDFELDNRTNEFSRSNNDADGSTAWGVKVAAGYELPIIDDARGWQLRTTPLVGYQKHVQRMRMTDGNQTLCNNAPSFGWDCTGVALGPFDGLNSRYKADWAGPFVGLEGELGFTDQHRFRVRGEYGYMDYGAEARWNLRQDFQQPLSYKHDADGTGLTLGAEYRYGIDPTTGIVLSAAYSKFKADDGTDRTFLAAGGEGESRLNEVSWETQAYRVGYEKQF